MTIDRRCVVLSALGPWTPFDAGAQPAATRKTRWRFTQSEGLDALLFLSPLSGAPLYSPLYGPATAKFRADMSPAVLKALDDIAVQASMDGLLLGPSLALVASGAPDRSFEDVIASLSAPERLLRRPFESSAYASPLLWRRFKAWAPRLLTILRALEAAGFRAWRREALEQARARRLPVLEAALGPLDVIAEQERLLGRALGPTIEVCLMWCVAPHAVKVQGQRFLAHVGYPQSVILLSAAHEMMHPPLPPGSPAEAALLKILRRDDLFSRIVREHDPAFGYRTLAGLANEDMVQALDQIVQERLGVVDKPPADRWRAADGGMHVLAAGLYQTLKASGYAASGGVLTQWVTKAAADGTLSPDRLQAAASQLLGYDVREWSARPRKPAQ